MLFSTVPMHAEALFWRRLENLPHFMTHLDRRADSGIHQGSVPPTASRSSQWAPAGSCSRPAGSKTALPDGQRDPGVITTAAVSTATDGFVGAIAKHRHFAKEADPPRV